VFWTASVLKTEDLLKLLDLAVPFAIVFFEGFPIFSPQRRRRREGLGIIISPRLADDLLGFLQKVQPETPLLFPHPGKGLLVKRNPSLHHKSSTSTHDSILLSFEIKTDNSVYDYYQYITSIKFCQCQTPKL